MKKLPTEKRIKERARILAREQGIKLNKSLHNIAVSYGFTEWKQLAKEIRKERLLDTPIPTPSLEFTADLDVVMTEEDFELLDQERNKDIDKEEKLKIFENKSTLVSKGIEFASFEPTMTGLSKSIIDAIREVRFLFEQSGFHYFDRQNQGPDFKVTTKAKLVLEHIVIESQATFYRPATKKGDPRMWFRDLSKLAEPQQVVAVIIHNEIPHLINLSVNNLANSLKNPDSEIGKLLLEITGSNNDTSEELLSLIKNISKNPIKSLRKGSTGVGFTLESLLNIDANSSKKPDFKGIEIKSGRGVKNRTTLFAQVPDWSMSPCKRSAEILNKYGYFRGDEFKLYCTLSTLRVNSQGLSFIYNQDKDQLEEWHENKDLVAVWSGEVLRKRLKEKHTETFWVEAESYFENGQEYFRLKSVTHTKAPVLSQLMPLIQSGIITMDHLIKRTKAGRVTEKGPLFKLNKTNLNLLFPEPKKYIL